MINSRLFTIGLAAATLAVSWPLTTRLLAAGAPSGVGEMPVSRELQQLVSDVARCVIPHHYEDTRHWGKTKQVVRGLHIRRDGLRIKTHRTRKAVNHGTWTRYRIELLDPEKLLQVRLRNVRQRPDGRIGFEIVCRARLHVFARLSQWQRGVQLVSLSADAETDVRLVLQAELAVGLDTADFPPDVVVEPTVRQADLHLTEFRLQRVSRLDGPLIKRLSSSVRERIEAEIQQRRTQMVTKINRQLESKQDQLRLSLRDALQLGSQGTGRVAGVEAQRSPQQRPARPQKGTTQRNEERKGRTS